MDHTRRGAERPSPARLGLGGDRRLVGPGTGVDFVIETVAACDSLRDRRRVPRSAIRDASPLRGPVAIGGTRPLEIPDGRECRKPRFRSARTCTTPALLRY